MILQKIDLDLDFCYQKDQDHFLSHLSLPRYIFPSPHYYIFAQFTALS